METQSVLRASSRDATGLAEAKPRDDEMMAYGYGHAQ